MIAEPALWVIGAAGFLFRGGWLVLGVPIWTLPSPVAVSTLLGPEAFGAGGLSPGLVALLVWVLALTGVVLAISAVGAAWADLTLFEHFVREPETAELRGRREARAMSRRAREAVLVRLLAIYAAALIPVGVAVFVAAVFLYDAAYQEFLLPGPLQVPLVLRVAGRAVLPLAVVVVCVLVAEAVTSAVSRWILASGFGLAGPPRGVDGPAEAPSRADGLTVPPGLVRGALAPIRRLRRVLLVAAGAWLVSIALVAPGLAASLLGWSVLRAVYLAPRGLERPEAAVLAGGVTMLFALLWAAALVLAGVASALRGALWNGWWLSEYARPVVTPGDAAPSR